MSVSGLFRPVITNKQRTVNVNPAATNTVKIKTASFRVSNNSISVTRFLLSFFVLLFCLSGSGWSGASAPTKRTRCQRLSLCWERNGDKGAFTATPFQAKGRILVRTSSARIVLKMPTLYTSLRYRLRDDLSLWRGG